MSEEPRRERTWYWRPRILDDILKSRHAIVEAGAGTGKTFTIEHLLVDLLRTTPYTIEQILIVTFTEKTTAELRGRIRRLLEEILEGAPSGSAANAEQVEVDQGARGRLERALWSFDRAPIFTIHGFCQRVLTELAFLAGTRFDMAVVDAYRPFHRAFRAELRERLADGSNGPNLLHKWLEEGGRIENLEALFLTAHQRRYLEANPAQARAQLAHSFVHSFDAVGLEHEFRSLSGVVAPRVLKLALATLRELERLVDGARGASATLLAALANFDFKPMTRVEDMGVSMNQTPFIRDFVSRAIELQLAAAIEGGVEDARETALVETFLPAVTARLDRDKREQGQIDYEDMLLWVWQALDAPDGAALADTLRARFRCGLADEFQDTDDLQYRILKRIFVEHSGENRLFVVGDPKQAIYAFRGADVHAYLRACGELSKAGASRVPLLTNFRSTAAVIEALNYIFDQSAATPFFSGEIGYRDPALCGQPARNAIDSAGNPVKPIVLMRYQEQGGKPGAAVEAREAIGRYIASTLRRLLSGDAGQLTIQEPDTAKGQMKKRAVRPRDIFVLTRTRRESEEIGRYLRDCDVPFAYYKLEGLFQSREARDVRDVLKAIDEPQDRSRRLRAWASRFFAVRYRDLATLGDVPDLHPLNERLYEWRALAETERFAELFDSLIHESGLAERELFLSCGERELTNFLHIFEVLVERAIAGRLSLANLIELLESYIAGRDKPAGADGNIQRLESEREAVQVMTVHMSKGLEADVVVLFGGSHRGPRLDKLRIYHSGGERRFVIGSGMQKGLVKDELKREETEEEQRLLYVALTRARAQLYLPFYPRNATKTAVDGAYKPLNDRLEPIVDSLGGDAARPAGRLFQIDDVCDVRPLTLPKAASLTLREWSPPAALIRDDSEPETNFARRRRDHAALLMSSYTSLKRAQGQASWDLAAEEFKTDIEAVPTAGDLPGGSRVGLFLHEAIERLLELQTFAESPRFESWREREDVKQIFQDTMRLHQVGEPRWLDRGRRIVFDTLTTRIPLDDGRIIGPLHLCAGVREMEFVFPIPETNHPQLANAGGAQWTVERGFLKGFVDLVFEQNGLVYFVDWKSDLLPSYERAAIEDHVKGNYDLQARIYLVGILRLLRIRSEADYAKRFGGLLYVFLRAAGASGDGRQGIYFHRPEWAEVCRLETELMSLPQLA